MKILLIEDEPGVSAFIKKGLEEQGYQVAVAFDGTTGLSLARKDPVDLLILDIILPQMNGHLVAKTLREEGYDMPILMLTALGSTDDVVKGLDAGADDYLAKPFQFRELLARTRALTRRRSDSGNRILQIDDLTMDLHAKKVQRNDVEIRLTAREFHLLEYLLRNQGRVLSRVDILENVWEMSFDPGTNVIDVYVNYLRKKIDRNQGTKLIHTVVGMGYVMRASAD